MPQSGAHGPSGGETRRKRELFAKGGSFLNENASAGHKRNERLVRFTADGQAKFQKGGCTKA
jgi:hypothetical protein